jgi:hypothetical protein
VSLIIKIPIIKIPIIKIPIVKIPIVKIPIVKIPILNPYFKSGILQIRLARAVRRVDQPVRVRGGATILKHTVIPPSSGR